MTTNVGPASFYSICEQAGLTLGRNGGPIALHAEISRFQRDVARYIQRAPSESECVESFLEGLQEHVEDTESLRMCLLPLAGSTERGSSFSLGESLIRVLMGIDSIQPGLMETLLDRMFGFLGEDEKDSPMPKLILQQLKWLNNIIRPEDLSTKLLEIISISPTSVKRDIITSLPEIIPDSEHKTVVRGLVELMESSSELLAPTLDALSNLNLQSDMLVNARNHVLGTLESADLDDLPIVIKFLLQTVESDTVGDVIETIRGRLDLRSINKLQRNPRNRSKRGSSSQTPEVLILDAMKTGIRFQKFVTDAWYKALVALTKPGQHRTIDVMVIFILHSIVSLKKKIETLIRKKVIEGQLTKKLLEDTILIHGESLREYMPAILSISEQLLRSSMNHPIVARTASALYTSSFQVSDAYYRQEIVGSLLVHIGSGSAIEIDASLAVLQNIVQVSRSTLNEYSAFIKGVLDYMDNLSLEQIRLFFVVLGSLAREDEVSGNTGTLITDINILIRKQLSNPLEHFKKIGVMGAIALVQAFGENDGCGGNERGSSSQAAEAASHLQAEKDPLLKTSVMYLHMIRDACRKSAICLALTFDELASMVLSGRLNPKLVLWIKEVFSNQFAETFVCGVNESFPMRPSRNIALERWMNLDGPESELSISIMPSLCADLSGTASQGTLIDTADGAVYLCSLFKLLQATEKATSDDGLDDIDGLLGCGITMFKQEYLEDIAEVYSTEICHAVAQGLLCAINWFREIANAFSYDASNQTMARIILRLQQISEMETMLRHVLKFVPGFKPLEASHIKSSKNPMSVGVPSISDARTIQSSMLSSNAAGKKSTREMDVDQPALKPFIVTSSEIVNYESLTPYFRELEIDVFQVLRVHEPITREIFEISEMADEGQRNKNKVQLRYPELRFLLKDLLIKVLYKLPPPVAHAPFGKKSAASAVLESNALLVRMGTAQFVMGILKVVPFLVTKMRIMLNLLYIDGQENDHDGEPVDNAIVLECLNIVLKVLQALLSWNELRGSDRKELRLELLKSLALDQKSEDEVAEIKKSINLSAIAVIAFENLAAWRETMPNFESAAILVEVVDKVLDLVPRNPETSVKASELAGDVLLHRWPVSNIIKNDKLAYVLGEQIGKSNGRLDLISQFVTNVLPSFLNQDEGTSEGHPMLNTNTFTTYTKVLYMQLASLVGEFQEEDFNDTQAAFDHISGLSNCFQKLAAFVKSNDKKEVLAVTLRHSKVFMEQFIKRILPFLGVHFRGHQDTVARIFKNHLQAATRSLQYTLINADINRIIQNVCGHAKASRQETLVAMVPAIKKTMESLIFEVKLMLENNDASAAFWLGNLKHRNLAGEEISSQLPEISEDEIEVDESEDGDAAAMSDLDAAAESKPSKKRARAGTKRKANGASGVTASKRKSTGSKTKGKSTKARRDTKARGDNDINEEDSERRIHTKSQITNSDISEDEQDQLVEEEDEDSAQRRRARKELEGDEGSAMEMDDDYEEDEDAYADSMLEKQDERAERRRRIRNPYIDDAAMEGDDDEEEDEEDEDEDGEGEDLEEDEDEE
ncbi:Fanconi anemia group D2 protein [Mortierella sp. GBA30]|nr:Fanconi anemia group D2 protein [Mortierella sp. GBA30]